MCACVYNACVHDACMHVYTMHVYIMRVCMCIQCMCACVHAGDRQGQLVRPPTRLFFPAATVFSDYRPSKGPGEPSVPSQPIDGTIESLRRDVTRPGSHRELVSHLGLNLWSYFSMYSLPSAGLSPHHP